MLDSTLAFAGRDFRVARSYRTAFAMTIAGMLMSLVTFRFLAKLAQGAPGLREVGDLFSFFVIGMAMAQVLEGALSGPAGSVRQEQVQGTLEVLATTPVSAAQLALGWVAYPLGQALVTGLIMIGIAGPMGLKFADPMWGVAVAALVLSSLAFAGLGILIAAVVLVIQQSAGLTKWVASGLALVSGVFFPLSAFPHWIGRLATISPLTHSLRALRGALLAGQGWSAARGDLLALGGFALVLLPLSVAGLSLGLRRARMRGTLGTY